MPDSADHHMKKTRRRHKLTKCPKDGLTKGKMDKQIQHKNEPLQGLQANFGMPKILPPLTKLLTSLRKSPANI